MSRTQSSSSSTSDLPERLESPDVGFVAAAGIYVAVGLVAATVTASLALEASTATIAGGAASAATAGLLAGAVGASQIEGLPERLGRRSRSLAIPFALPGAFVLASIAVLTVPSLPSSALVGTGFGAVGGAAAAAGIALMARERYAQAMTPDEPRVTVPRLAPGYHRRWIGFGLAWVGIALGIATVAAIVQRLERPAAAVIVGAVFVVGLSFAFAGFTQWLQFTQAQRREDGDGGPVNSLLPERPRRKVFGAEWSQDLVVRADPSMLPQLRVHDRGLVVGGPTGHRFVPWETVADVSLTPDLLVVERTDSDPIRCRRSVIDDPERALEELERARADAEATPDVR